MERFKYIIILGKWFEIKEKNLVNTFINKYPDLTKDNIIKKICSYDIVSFDIFDTLVNRNVATPTDIFDLVARKCLENQDDINRFRECRIKAEREARLFEKKNEDVSLNKIYECIDERFRPYVDELKQTEISCEVELTYPNPIVQEVYYWCLKHHKKIFFISDMYLDKNTIKIILDKCGYVKYDELFISSEIGLLKATGNLFAFILKNYNLEKENWIHIGDSIRGDFIGAKKNKLSVVRIARNPSRTMLIRKKSFESRYWQNINNILSGHLVGNESIYYRYGFEIMSPFLCSFSIWLNNKARERGIQKLFFLARDGYLLQKVYAEVIGNNAIPNYYLYVSRRALRIPVLSTCRTFDDFFSFIPQNKYLSRMEIFDLLGLTDEEISDWIMAGFADDEQVYTNKLLENDKFVKFYNTIERKCKHTSKSLLSIYTAYLIESGFYGNVGIVDIGWAGTIQKCLNRIVCSTNRDVQLSGFYVGLTEEAENTIDGIGYIPSYYRPQVATAGLFEYPFLAHEGSLKKMDIIDGTITPIVGEYEYANDIRDQKYIDEIQKGVLDGVKAIKRTIELWQETTVDDAFMALYELTKKPTLKESRIFGELCFYDGNLYPLAKPKSILDYMFNPTLFLKDFSSSGWKVGFMKRMIKIPFPYASLLENIKKRGSNL